MFTSLYIKKNAYLFNPDLNDYIIKSNDKYMKQMIEYKKERELKKIMYGFDEPSPPQKPPNTHILFGFSFLSLTTIIYYFYSRRS
jgi:hypothetical protein